MIKRMHSRISLIIIFSMIVISCKDDPITPNIPPLSDSTSHNFIWELDTLGTFQSRLRDCWGTNENNIWVVGFLYLDSSGTNIAHWNGQVWNYFPEVWEAGLLAITGLSDSDIWAVGQWSGAPTPTGSGAFITHWNGLQWSKTKLTAFEGLRGIWAYSDMDIYAVGYNGTILHYNGSSWSKMLSHTNYTLYDIWGTTSSDIYAVGGDDSQGIGILLHYDGITWQKIYERAYIVNKPSGFMSTIWGTLKEYYLNSGSGQYKGKDTLWDFVSAPTDNTYLESIRGESDKNFFFIGHFGLIVHWNGKSWKRYDEFFRKPAGDILYGGWVKEKDVVIVGRSEVGARGIVYRGKMIY